MFFVLLSDTPGGFAPPPLGGPRSVFHGLGMTPVTLKRCVSIWTFQHLFIIVHLLPILRSKPQSTAPFNPMPFHIIFKPACWRSGLLAGLPVCLLAGRQVSRQASQMAGWTAGRLERGQACRPACVCSHVFSFMQTHIQSGLQAFMRI